MKKAKIRDNSTQKYQEKDVTASESVLVEFEK
jgi:hypothetical protein